MLQTTKMLICLKYFGLQSVFNKVLLCWGITKANNVWTVQFPISYTKSCSVNISQRPTDSETTFGMINHLLRTRSNTGFSMGRDGWTNQYIGSMVDWMSIGY